jgi:hypothetical protein
LATLLITRQVVGNIKESLIPYAKKHFKLAKMNYDVYGAFTPTGNEKKDDDCAQKQQQEQPMKQTERNVSQVEVESSYVEVMG